ncbi:hypothetical protein Vadar_034565 [Vaccinium darrowii]|uniref:Uncharacterized protein n=1 Tax=Vaccinium darrowii TaxID=229202 RepID=A0ACB7Y582_9ERIC|nr:hypothetical protein Vadar_034565 [Vaccinium darrowii]
MDSTKSQQSAFLIESRKLLRISYVGLQHSTYNSSLALALSPSHALFEWIVDSGLYRFSSTNGWMRVAEEKPFGQSSESSAALTKSLKRT